MRLRARTAFISSIHLRRRSCGPVLGKIQQSYYEDPRQMYLFFYYPFEAEVAALMTAGSLQFVDEIDCTELYENYDRRERILVFEMG